MVGTPLKQSTFLSHYEEEFGIRFKMKEISCIQNIGELVECIIYHLNERHHQ